MGDNLGGTVSVPETPEKKTSLDRQLLLENLDQTIFRLSDDPSAHPPQAPTTEEESLIRTFAPKNQESAFQELFSLLYPCLRPRLDESDDSTTASAIIMGPRGSGKSLLVERCLAACQHQARTQTKQPANYRKVMINGIVVRGEDVPSVVYEMIRQLSDIALMSPPGSQNSTDAADSKPTAKTEGEQLMPEVHATGSKSPNNGDGDPEEDPEETRRKRLRSEKDEHLLRLRKSTFTSNLALLESIFQMAEVDRIPIVLILDEFDALLDQKGDRQVLLYHLLDRVATPGSNLILLGLTSSFVALTQMEKRIRSRAEGTSKIIHVRPPTSYEQLREMLGEKFRDSMIQTEIGRYFSPQKKDGTGEDHATRNVTYTLQREFRMGRDLRWFTRVLSSALSLYRYDCISEAPSQQSLPSFSPEYFMEALMMMGATSLSDATNTSATHQDGLCLVNGMAISPRLQALLDMSQPQVALLLAARRILNRDAQRELVVTVPLTFERMLQEYQSFRKGVRTYSVGTLKSAAYQLLERGLLVPSIDHSGRGPFQYHVSLSYQNLDPYAFSRLPLHLPVDMEREFEEALKRNLLDCSTGLKEWGRKTN